MSLFVHLYYTNVPSPHELFRWCTLLIGDCQSCLLGRKNYTRWREIYAVKSKTVQQDMQNRKFADPTPHPPMHPPPIPSLIESHPITKKQHIAVYCCTHVYKERKHKMSSNCTCKTVSKDCNLAAGDKRRRRRMGDRGRIKQSLCCIVASSESVGCAAVLKEEVHSCFTLQKKFGSYRMIRFPAGEK